MFMAWTAGDHIFSAILFLSEWNSRTTILQNIGLVHMYLGIFNTSIYEVVFLLFAYYIVWMIKYD